MAAYEFLVSNKRKKDFIYSITSTNELQGARICLNTYIGEQLGYNDNFIINSQDWQAIASGTSNATQLVEVFNSLVKNSSYKITRLLLLKSVLYPVSTD